MTPPATISKDFNEHMLSVFDDEKLQIMALRASDLMDAVNRLEFEEWMQAETLMKHKYLTLPCKRIRMEWERKFDKYCNGIKKRDQELAAARHAFYENLQIRSNMMHWVKLNVMSSIQQMMKEKRAAAVHADGYEIGDLPCPDPEMEEVNGSTEDVRKQEDERVPVVVAEGVDEGVDMRVAFA